MQSEPGHEFVVVVFYVIVEERTVILKFTSAFHFSAGIPILTKHNTSKRMIVIRVEIEKDAFISQITSTIDPGRIPVSFRKHRGMVKSLFVSEEGGLLVYSFSIRQFHERQPNSTSLLSVIKSQNT